jgi:hypothetical protein
MSRDPPVPMWPTVLLSPPGPCSSGRHGRHSPAPLVQPRPTQTSRPATPAAAATQQPRYPVHNWIPDDADREPTTHTGHPHCACRHVLDVPATIRPSAQGQAPCIEPSSWPITADRGRWRAIEPRNGTGRTLIQSRSDKRTKVRPRVTSRRNHAQTERATEIRTTFDRSQMLYPLSYRRIRTGISRVERRCRPAMAAPTNVDATLVGPRSVREVSTRPERGRRQ